MGKDFVYYIESRVAVNNLLGLVSHCIGEMPEPELGNEIPAAAGELGVCV